MAEVADMNSIAKIRSLGATLILLAAGPRIFAMPQRPNHDLAVVETEANAGNPAAQFLLGLRYGAGEGVREDQARAENWLRVAAESGLVEAQSALGELYLIRGSGYEPEGEKWLTMAADKGDGQSAALLGSFSAKGLSGGQAPPPEAIFKERQPAASEWTRASTGRTDTAFVGREAKDSPAAVAVGQPPLIPGARPERPLKQEAPATFQQERRLSLGWETWVLGAVAVATLSGLLVGRRF